MTDSDTEARDPALSFLRILHNDRFWDLASPAFRALDEAGIPVVVLKGLPQMIELYGDAGLRPMADIDLLVPGDQAYDVLQHLRAGGWVLEHGDSFDRLCTAVGEVRAAKERPWHLVLVSEQGVSAIDLHSDSMDPWRDPPLDVHVWERTRVVDTRGVRHLVLDDVDRLVYLCWHFVADGFPWGKLSDIQQILISGRRLDWHLVATRARQTGMTTVVWLVCELAFQRSTESMPAPWRGALRPPIRRRATFAHAWLEHARDELDQRRTILVRTLLHDHPTLMLRASLETVLPGPVELVASGSTHSTEPGPYLLGLATLYRHRIVRPG